MTATPPGLSSEGLAEAPAIVAVAVATPLHAGMEAALAYRTERAVPPGTLVRVPLGTRQVVGIVAASEGVSEATTPLRAIDQVLDAVPPLSPAWLDLAAFASTYYLRSFGELALAVLPTALRQLDRSALADRRRRWFEPSAKPARRGAAEKAAMATTRPVAVVSEAPLLSREQAAALADVEAARRHDEPGVLLLHGATGSGKTEVYLRAAEAVLGEGGQALILVPEINLTPQLIERFGERFGHQRIATLHSGLTPVARLRHWLQAHLGQADLVLGTRLAVFASLPRLRLIVVDEEHDPSYKQQEGARYSARDLAVWRGRREAALVVLGSATPSLETWQRAEQGRYRRATMAERIGGATWPTVRLLDTRRLPAPPPGRPSAAQAAGLAPEIVAAIERCMGRGEQSLLFLNRRGYAPVLQCAECGWLSACPHCSAWRVFHKQDRRLHCHHCGLAAPVPRACPDCGNPDIAPVGRGTERLEEQLTALLPLARIARIDADTTRRRGALEAQLTAVHVGEVDVIVGTQMIAKGHDFRKVGLVVAVNPDTALFSSDFRAPERLFSLLMQAAGRAGRAAGTPASEMWVQTGHPQHPLYQALTRHDYGAFAASQLAERAGAGLPPYSHLALLRADAKQAETARAFLAGAAAVAAALGEAEGVMVYPPVPLAIARVADVERWQMLVESASRRRLQAFLHAWLPQLDAGRRQPAAGQPRILRWAIDVDPSTI